MNPSISSVSTKRPRLFPMLRILAIMALAIFHVGCVQRPAVDSTRWHVKQSPVATQPDSWKLELFLDKSEYFVGEPFTARAKLTNGNWAATVENSFTFGRKLRLFYGSADTADMKEWDNRALVLDNFIVYGKISPYPNGIQDENFFAGGPFAQAGRVHLQARFSGLSSEIVTVTVVPPSPDEAEAIKLWLHPNVMVEVENPGVFYSAKSEVGLLFEELITKFGNTRYGQWALAAKARAETTEAWVRGELEKAKRASEEAAAKRVKDSQAPVGSASTDARPAAPSAPAPTN